MTAAFERVLGRLPRGARALAWAGILAGILAFWVTLPPVKVREPIVAILIGLAAVGLGVAAVRQGVRRLGWGAVAIGVLGILLGYLATRSSVTHLDQVIVWSALTAAMLRYATPLAFAAMGGIFSERSGVVNIGLEGMMLSGAFFGILGADKLNSWPLGLLCAALAGAVFAFIHAFFAIQLRADQIVGGTAINFLALGITGYLFIDIYGGEGTPPDIPKIPSVHLGFLEDWYFIGPVLGQLNLMIWLALLTIVATWVVLFKTPVGLRVRAVGEHPRAADTVGISVYATRYVAVTLSGVLAALGGAYISIGFVNSFNQNMTVGRGFIALAAVIFGNWRPWGAAAAALLFGFSSALAQRLPAYSESAAVLFQALPYVLTLIAVAGVIGRSKPPASVGRPYQKQ
ncbi:MAG TPA: ABC transporter permease [Gaiellaceae bacterium]|nr:ABC transporter permease [Gaiellaceae bacterium]